MDGGLFSHAHKGQIAGRDLHLGPDRAQVGDGEHGRAVLHGLAHRQMLFNHHTIKRSSQLEAVQPSRSSAGIDANGGQLLLGVGGSNFGLAQSLLGLQVVLLRRDLFLPQLLFTLIGGARQRQALLRRQQLAALLGNRGAGQHRQQLPLFDHLSQIGGNALGHPGNARHHMGGLVVVKADFSRQLQAAANGRRAGHGHRHSRRFGALCIQSEQALFFILRMGCSAFLHGLFFICMVVIVVMFLTALFMARIAVAMRMLGTMVMRTTSLGVGPVVMIFVLCAMGMAMLLRSHRCRLCSIDNGRCGCSAQRQDDGNGNRRAARLGWGRSHGACSYSRPGTSPS